MPSGNPIAVGRKRRWLSWAAFACLGGVLAGAVYGYSTPYGRFIRNVGRAVVVNKSDDEVMFVRLSLAWSDRLGKNEWTIETDALAPGEERVVDVGTADLHVNEIKYSIKGREYRNVVAGLATSGTTVAVVIRGPNDVQSLTGFTVLVE